MIIVVWFHGRRFSFPAPKSVTIPYSGAQQLWLLCPSHHQLMWPNGVLIGAARTQVAAVQLVVTQPADEPPETIKSEIDRQLASIRFFVGSSFGQVKAHNDSIAAQVKPVVAARKKRLSDQDGLQAMLGIPLQRKDGVPDGRGIEAVCLARTCSDRLPHAGCSSLRC